MILNLSPIASELKIFATIHYNLIIRIFILATIIGPVLSLILILMSTYTVASSMYSFKENLTSGINLVMESIIACGLKVYWIEQFITGKEMKPSTL